MESVYRVEEEEVVVTVEEVLLPRRRQTNLDDATDTDSSESSDDAKSGGYEVPQNGISDENSVYFDEQKGDGRIQQSEIDNREEITSDVILTGSPGENVTADESGDEEVIELEFESAVDKIHTHTPYCPNCNSKITKVILRRKIRARPHPDEQRGLFGCLSCLSIFKPSGDCLNPFIRLFEGIIPQQPPSSGSGGGTDQHRLTSVGDTGANIRGTWSCLNPFDCFGGSSSNSTNPEGVPEINKPPHAAVVIPDEPEQRPTSHANQDSKWFEILKCIVYGGLIESIASLSVVSSAAASDATTLNVVVIGLATLLSGLFAFGCNLANLSGENYKEVLGQSGHFLFHSTFAILSYLIFGLVAPTTYALAFRESDNKDYKILAVAAAGFGCIFILAIAKSYVKGYKFGGYIKTILSYVTMAVSASAVAYATGDLIGKLLGDLGWFQPAPDSAGRVSAWASY